MAITKIKGKKAIFFTVISIILVAGLIFFYINANKTSMLDSTKVIEKRVISINSLIGDIEHDIVRGLQISSMRSLIGMSEFMTKNGTFLPDFTTSFNEVMINGTINRSIIDIARNATFSNWTEKIIDISKKLDVDVEFHNLYITPYHENPWDVRINIIGAMNLTDRKGLASWNRQINLTTTISILDFEDPIYTVTSRGKLTNEILKNNVTDFVSGSDATNLIEHANNSWYIASTLAPSFLMRFAGNLSPSPFGIESIVNVEELELAAPELYLASSSAIDYIYFGNNSIPDCQINETITTIPWLRLDNDHLNTYESTCTS